MDTQDNIDIRHAMAHYELRARVRYAKAGIAARFALLEREFELRREARIPGWQGLAAMLILSRFGTSCDQAAKMFGRRN